MKSEFRTADLGLAAYLKVSCIELLNITPFGRKRSVFVFLDTDSRQSLVMDFFNHRSKVDALEYLNTLKSLKAMAMEMKGSGNDSFPLAGNPGHSV